MTQIDEILWRLERIEKRMIELTSENVNHDEAKEALKNIEEEIIARSCRSGVCED
jgi:hypothetical protein